jgi:hypothetical protein
VQKGWLKIEVVNSSLRRLENHVQNLDEKCESGVANLTSNTSFSSNSSNSAQVDSFSQLELDTTPYGTYPHTQTLTSYVAPAKSGRSVDLEGQS